MRPYLFLVVAFLFLAAGFSAGMLKQPSETICTSAFCACESDGEIECNSCLTEDDVFYTGLVNVVEQCSSIEMVVCEDGTHADSYQEPKGCELQWEFFRV